MALLDILAAVGDGQDFILEIPTGNSSYTPPDVLVGDAVSDFCVEIPTPTGGGGGNIFIMTD